MRHTPGPWKFEIRNYQAMVTTERDDIDMVVASNLFDEELDPELEEVEANARLIATAPDLLEALQSLLASLENIDFSHLDYLAREDGDGSVYDRIPWELTEKAIARATGKEENVKR